MARLADYAQTLRSKNAGALLLTIDVVLKSDELYKRLVQNPCFSPGAIAKLYGLREDQVEVMPYPQVRAIKVTMPRLVASGDLQDSDVYGAQQHVPLMMIELD